MPVVYPVCCGIDVHQAQLTAFSPLSPEGQITTEQRDCGTTYHELLALSDWLAERHCPVVALERTGVYWRPVYHVSWGPWRCSWAIRGRCGRGRAKRRTKPMPAGRGAVGAWAHPPQLRAAPRDQCLA